MNAAAFESFLSARRRQLQDWEAGPPTALGWGIFGLVVFEIVLARRLFHEAGLSVVIVGQILGTALMLAGLAYGFARFALAYARTHDRTGSFGTLFTMMNLGTAPFLLFLPFTLLAYLAGDTGVVRFAFFLVLAFKTIGNWREAAEVVFELSRFQGVRIVTLYLGALLVLATFVGYAGIIARFAA